MFSIKRRRFFYVVCLLSCVAFAGHSAIKQTNANQYTTDTQNTVKTTKIADNASDFSGFSGLKNIKNIAKSTKNAKTISFADNEQINVSLSKVDINRISIQGDKIQSLNGPTGLYTAKNDPNGAAYLTLYANTPFILYVSTVNNHSLSLFITPQAAVGRTIVLIPTSPTKTADHLEDNSVYQKLMITLMNAMINKKALDDYAYSEPKKTKSVKSTDFFGMASLKPIAFYNGAELNGIIYEIKNKTREPITLRPSYFYQSGVRAIALSTQTIESNATDLLYEIVNAE